MTAYQVLCILGIPTLVLSMFRYLHTLVKKNATDNLAMKKGIQALLRSNLISDYNKWVEKGYAPIYARQNFENCPQNQTRSDFMARTRFSKKTYTKKAVKAILAIALIDLQLTYALAFLGKEQIAETLSGDICKVIIGTILGYLAKSFFETKEEEKNKIQKAENAEANEDWLKEGMAG